MMERVAARIENIEILFDQGDETDLSVRVTASASAAHSVVAYIVPAPDQDPLQGVLRLNLLAFQTRGYMPSTSTENNLEIEFTLEDVDVDNFWGVLRPLHGVRVSADQSSEEVLLNETPRTISPANDLVATHREKLAPESFRAVSAG